MINRAITIFLFCIVACGFTGKRVTLKQPPNIIFILVDDLGWKDVGSYGSTFYETPYIDALAAKGMSFTNAYAASPVCSPTRASILAGKHPVRLGTTDWFGAPQPEDVYNRKTWKNQLFPASYKEYLPLEEKTIAEALKEYGYTTFFAGKWHLGYDERYWPEHQGFDVNKGGFFMGHPPRNGKANGYFPPYGNPRLGDGPKGEYLPHRLAEETVTFIEQHQDQPFLAYLSFYSVHTPLMTTEELQAKYERKREELGLTNNWWGKEGNRKVRKIQNHAVYAGMVEAMDQAVGRITSKLRELDIDDNTIIIFTSDNGGLSTAEGHPTSNMPLRAGKGWLYEGGIRVPLIIKWPEVTKPGSVSTEPVISMDFYPTILHAAYLPPESEQHLDGQSLVPLLKGEVLDHRPLYWHYPHYGNQGGSPGSVIRDGKWKLIEWYEDRGKIELYNLHKDIEEKYDVSDEYPDTTKRLYEQLKEWRSSMDAREPSLNPIYKPR